MADMEDQIPEEMRLDTGDDLPVESPEDTATADQIIEAKNTAQFDVEAALAQLAESMKTTSTPAVLVSAPAYAPTAAQRSDVVVPGDVPTSSPGTYDNSGQDSFTVAADAVGASLDSIGDMTPQQVMSEVPAAFMGEAPANVTQDHTQGAFPTSTLEESMSSVPVTSSIKTGSQVTVPQTQEFINAQGAVQGEVKNVQASLQEKQNQLTQLQQLAAPFEAQRAQIAQAHLTKLDEIQARGEEQYAQAREEADQLRHEMANTPWTTFWGSKSTGDRLLLAMAVGLGAYSQTRIGGQNVALGMISDLVSEHTAQQKNIHQNLKDRLAATSSDAQTILTGTQRLQAIENARNTAAYDQVQKELDMMQSRVKTEQSKTNLQMLSAQVALKARENDLKNAQETKLKSTLTSDVMATTNSRIPLGKAQFVNAKGQIEDMGESDKVRFGYMNEQAVSHKDMTALEKAGVLNDSNYVILWNNLTNPPAAHLGKEIRGMADYLSLGGIKEDTVNANPRLRQYLQSVLNSADPAGRAKSGGVMNAGEMADYLRQRMPAPQDMNNPNSAQSLQNVQTFRQNELKSKRGLLNANHIVFPFEVK